MKTRRKSPIWSIGMALVVPPLVSACGGDSNSDLPPLAAAQVPASASQSIAGFIEYLQEPVVSSAETLEPVDTSMVTAPTDETSEPLKVD